MTRRTLRNSLSRFLFLFALGALLVTGCDSADTEEFALNLSEEFERIAKDDGHTYYVSDSSYTWPEAKARAAEVTDASEGHLVTFSSASEENLVADSEDAPSNFWLGLTDRQAEGEWRWTTGEPLTYTNWEDGEPNDARGGEDVAEWGDGRWNDTIENAKKPFVLELER